MCNEHNWSCKHIEKVRSSQPSILALNWIKQFFPVSIVKVKLKKNVQGKQNLQTDQMEDHVVFSCELNYTTTR